MLRLEPSGRTRRFYVRRRDLLREHRLQPRDLRRIDPAIEFTKTSPSITVKEDALLLCLGGVRCGCGLGQVTGQAAALASPRSRVLDGGQEEGRKQQQLRLLGD